jgi:hypothetical protein
VRAPLRAWQGLTDTWIAGARFGQGDTTVKLRRDNTYIISITCAPAIKLRYSSSPTDSYLHTVEYSME